MLKKPPASFCTSAAGSITVDGRAGAGAGLFPDTVSQANSRWRISVPCVWSNTAASNDTLLLL